MTPEPSIASMIPADGLPVRQRRAATHFIRHGVIIHQDLTNPLNPPATKYQTLAYFYLTRGHQFDKSPLTGEEIAVLHGLSAMDLSFFRPGACFRNAILVAHQVPGLSYAEGIGIYHGNAMLHAWLALGRKAIDVTWPISHGESPSRRFDRMLQRIDHNLRHSHYFGITIPIERVINFVLTTKTFSPILSDGHGLRRAPARRIS